MTSYEVAQLVVQIVAVGALLLTLYVYYRMLRTMSGQLEATRNGATAQNILALTNFLQAPEVRAAREIVRVDLSKKDFNFWTPDERREASRVCLSRPR